MRESDIPYKYICKERGDNCRCSEEEMKVCCAASRIIDEEKLKKIIRDENRKSYYSSYAHKGDGG